MIETFTSKNEVFIKKNICKVLWRSFILAGTLFFIIFVILLIVFIRFLYHKSDFIKFFTTGLDSGFKLKEIYLLYQAASFSNIPEPVSLFLSVPALNNCIAFILKDVKTRHIDNDPKIIKFIEKLYKYRTKVELDPKNSHSMKTTKSLKTGQKLRIVLKGFGVFASQVVNSGRELLITLPLQKKTILLSGNEWINRNISVYLQRAGDAGYVFDTVVKDITLFHGATALVLEHTDKLIRSQKRKSVRCACNILGQLYIVNSEIMSQTAIETSAGLKCLVEDISEDGALIRIGGKGKKNIKIKLQFLLNDNYIVMFGIVRAVEYNASANQSRLHFECVTLPQKMKNNILTYVYNVIPQEEKDNFEAIAQAEADANGENLENDEEKNVDSKIDNTIENTEDSKEKIETSSSLEREELQDLDVESELEDIQEQNEMFVEFLKSADEVQN